MSTEPRPAIRDMIFAMEMLRRLGFNTMDMNPMSGNIDGLGPGYWIRLQAQEKTFDWIIAANPGISSEQFVAEFGEAVAEWNRRKGADNNTWGYFQSNILNETGTGLVIALQAKGFIFPYMAN